MSRIDKSQPPDAAPRRLLRADQNAPKPGTTGTAKAGHPGNPELAVTHGGIGRDLSLRVLLTKTAPKKEVTLAGTTFATANAAVTMEEAGVLGTRSVPGVSPGSAPRILEGPHTLDPDAVSAHPGAAAALFQSAAIRATWGAAHDPLAMIGVAKQHLAYEPVSGPEVVGAVSEWGMKPGDWFIVGQQSHSHLSMYVGQDEQGTHMILHAMATAKPNKSFLGTVWGTIKLVAAKLGGGELDKVGVFKEPIEEFFARYPRGAVTGMRDPRLTDAMRKQGLAHLERRIGTRYDYSFAGVNEGIYCSELQAEFIEAAYRGSQLAVPWMGTTHVKAGTIDQFVYQPNNATVSPDFQILGANELGKQAVQQDFQQIVVAKPSA